MDDKAIPNWYLSMDQFLTLVTEVVKSSENSWSFTGKNIHDKAHPEDLMIAVSSAAEMIALTLSAIAKVKPHLFEENQ